MSRLSRRADIRPETPKDEAPWEWTGHLNVPHGRPSRNRIPSGTAPSRPKAPPQHESHAIAALSTNADAGGLDDRLA